jgi:hypothetical protein
MPTELRENRVSWSTRLWRWLLPVLVFAVAGPALRAVTPAPHTEYQVKAAFLLNFTKFVTWPAGCFPETTAPIVIGILGDNPFGDELARSVAGQRVQGRPILIEQGRSPAALAHCHLLFISGSERSRLKQHLAALREAHSAALTVSDVDGFLAAGGMIRFVVEQNKVRFEINAENAAAAEVSISSKLLSLAVNTRARS